MDVEIKQNALKSLAGVKADIAANVDRHILLVSMLTKSAEQFVTGMSIEDCGIQRLYVARSKEMNFTEPCCHLESSISKQASREPTG